MGFLFILYFLGVISEIGLSLLSGDSTAGLVTIGYAILTFVVNFVPIQVYTRMCKTTLYTDEYKWNCILIPVITSVMYSLLLFLFLPWNPGGIYMFWMRSADDILGAIPWGMLSYRIGKKYLSEKMLLLIPFFYEKLNLYKKFYSTNDIRQKQEILLAFASENKNKYSHFTAAGWSNISREWFSSISTPELGEYNAFDILLYLVSDKKTYDLAKITLICFGKDKGMPKQRNRDEIIASIVHYKQVWVHEERMNNPFIDSKLLQEMQEQYELLSRQASNQSHTSVSNAVMNTTTLNGRENNPFENQTLHTITSPIGEGTNNKVYTVSQLPQTDENPNDQYSSTKVYTSKQIETKPYNSMNVSNAQSGDICPKCAARIPQRSTFCFKCGYKIN